MLELGCEGQRVKISFRTPQVVAEFKQRNKLDFFPWTYGLNSIMQDITRGKTENWNNVLIGQLWREVFGLEGERTLKMWRWRW